MSFLLLLPLSDLSLLIDMCMLQVKLDRSVMNEMNRLPGVKKVRQALEEKDRRGNGKVTREGFRSALQEGCKLDLLEREWKQVRLERESIWMG